MLYLGQNQSNLRELKNENHFLKDYIHRLNAASSEYQTTHPPKTLKKEMNVCNLTLFHSLIRHNIIRSEVFAVELAF